MCFKVCFIGSGSSLCVFCPLKLRPSCCLAVWDGRWTQWNNLSVNYRLNFVLKGSHSLDDPSCTLIHFSQVCVRSCNQITRFGIMSVQYVFCGPRTARCVHYVTHGYRVGVLWLQPPLNPLWANKHTRPVYELWGGAGIGRQTDPVTVTLQLSLVCNIKTGAVWNDRLLPPAAPSALLCSIKRLKLIFVGDTLSLRYNQMLFYKWFSAACWRPHPSASPKGWINATNNSQVLFDPALITKHSYKLGVIVTCHTANSYPEAQWILKCL